MVAIEVIGPFIEEAVVVLLNSMMNQMPIEEIEEVTEVETEEDSDLMVIPMTLI